MYTPRFIYCSLLFSMLYYITEGTIPAEWGNIAALREVNFAFNKLTGELPIDWCNLPLLVAFDIRDMPRMVCYSACFYSDQNYTQGAFYMGDTGVCGQSEFLIVGFGC